ncbi:glycogen debranching protein GlgX [Blastococcus sp. Marseille-P5729]|uniref:glycogen debranching protein GlgX n=1 Tax=Blastococcus sp. Marseille-P5729 TaxID=2086582 RepID=UPI000D0EA659|nr:glycogen debranching protein GlgX [Blastococcus sp. Marseille-P5729]
MCATTPDAVGATTDGRETVFRVHSRAARRIELCLIEATPERTSIDQRCVEMQCVGGGIWEARAAVGPGTTYGYRVHGEHDPARGRYANPAKLMADPYAQALVDAPGTSAEDLELLRMCTPDGAPDPRDSIAVAPWSVVCADRAPVPSTRPRLPAGGRIIYEAHLGQLTATLPDVPERYRGTFAALRSRMLIEHLASMGVSTLELLPVAHWASEIKVRQRGQRNVWGYNPLGFFSPMPHYCVASDIDARWDEIAGAVATLHAAGIEVVLDVVFNHTCEGAANDPAYHLRGIDNLAYYLTDPDDPGRYVDVTGCGNSLNAASEPVQDLVVAALRHWVQRTDVDGFRFDLATTLGREPHFSAHHPLLRRIGDDALLGDRLLIAEPWDAGPNGYQLGGFTTPTRGEPWAEWNDRFRSTVRDFWRPGHGSRADLATVLAGSHSVWGARRAGSSIGYVTAHDGFTLHDLVSYDTKHNHSNGESNRDGSADNQSWNGGVEGETDDARVRELRLRRQGSILGCLMLQIGTPMITAGDERDRTQRGNNNPYCLDRPHLAVSWEPTPEADHLTALMQAFASTRREHAPLFDGRWLVAPGERGGHVVEWLDRQALALTEKHWHDHDKVLQVHYPASSGRGPLLILLNGNHERAMVRLPSGGQDGGWRIGIDTADPSRVGVSVPDDEPLLLNSFSLMVLAD